MASSHFARLDKHLAWCYSTAMMLPPTHPQDLFDCLRSALQNGGQLTDGLLDYVETALFLPRPDRLAAFLRNDDDSERDSLLDLIFYPEPDFQVLLEPLLMATPLTADDAAALRGRLLDEDIQAPVRMPDGTPLAHIPLPAFVKSHYLDRLNLAWQPDASLAAAITSGVAPARVPVVRVRLRNQGARPVAGQQVFLCRFFERLPDDDPDFLACLDLVLSLVAEASPSADAYQLLVHHKRRLFRDLQQARRFEALLRQSNMETLMLQGVRPPHADCNEWLEQMRLIDRICFGMFGRNEPLQLPMEEPLHEISDLDDPAAAIRFLWR
ncbi:conserved hypothetical protein [Desulfosarcina cetonica]|nr:conserved hypothetical protein [Desulfosarcina cetonica]